MLRRLCTARETKLQLATSLARGRPSAIEVKITSPECLNAPSGTPVTPPGDPSTEPFPPGPSGDGRGGRSARHGRGLASRCGQSSHPAARRPHPVPELPAPVLGAGENGHTPRLRADEGHP